MIESLEIENFKSMADVKVKLQPFTVLVGANGSGKSNFVKALAFLGAIPGAGMLAAINAYGGIDSLMPKMRMPGLSNHTMMRFRYSVCLPPPENYPDTLPPVSVTHEFSIQRRRRPKGAIRIVREKLTFYQVLEVAQALDRKLRDQGAGLVTGQPTWFSLAHDMETGATFESSPPLEQALGHYQTWLGLSFLRKQLTPEDLRRVVGEPRSARRLREKQTSPKRPEGSFLDPGMEMGLGFAPQFRIFRATVGDLRRYDLLLNHLRSEQQVSQARRLFQDGSNMPSVTRLLLSDRTAREAWSRIQSTLAAICPHVASLRTNALGTGKEFVEFVERFERQPIGSWETSDGTLRALAILLALETSPSFSTILIEEPEQNLHPWAVRSIVDHIRQVIKERHLQVIVTTHSQQVLERAFASEVLVVSRSEHGLTELRTLEQILPDTPIAMGEVGRLWVDGLLGGVPS